MSKQHENYGRPANEAELVSALVRMLLKQRYRVRTEVSNMGQSVDIVAIRGRWVTVVEAKLRNWKRAVEQCRAHEQVADFVCIAVASSTVAHALLDIARKCGYGVIHLHPRLRRFQWTLRPARNRRIWRPQRRQWAKGIRGTRLCQ